MRGSEKRARHASPRVEGAVRHLPEEENEEKAQELQAQGKGGILPIRKDILQGMQKPIPRRVGNQQDGRFPHLLQVPRSQEA